MVRRLTMILSMIIIIISLSGCWDRREMDDLGIVAGIAVETMAGGNVRVIVQSINTQAVVKGAGGGGTALTYQKAYRNTVAEGESIEAAINNLTEVTPIQRFFSHSNVVVISEEMARTRGIREILDYLERNPELRLDPWVVVARGSLISLMDQPGRITLIPAQRISNYMKISKISSSFAPRNVGQFIRMMQSSGSQPYTAVIEIRPNQSLPNEAGHSTENGVVPEPVSQIAVNGTAVFKQDKMVGWLNKSESRGLLWIKGEVKQATLSFPIPGDKDESAVTVITKSKCWLKPVIKDEQIIMTANIKADSYLVEVEGKIDPGKTDELKKLETMQRAAIESEIRSALNKAQKEYNSDIFGFGDVVHRSYPELWKQLKEQWDEIFPTLEVQINVESNIRHTSLISKPAEPAAE